MSVSVLPQQGPAQVRRRRGRQRVLLPWLFLLPIISLNVVVILGPSVGSAFYAFTEWSGMGPAKFVGLANFRQLLADRLYHKALGNNIKWIFFFLTVPIGMGLLGAWLLSSIKRFEGLYRVAFFTPYVLASVVNTSIWRNLYHPVHGAGPWLAKTFGWEWADIKFLGNTRTVLLSITTANSWQYWGFLMVLYLAAMQAINLSLYEAARIEGANRWQQFRYVTLPGIRSTLVFSFLITIIWGFLAFDYVYLLTEGGPAHASELMSTMVYSAAFQKFDVGYAAAIGLSMSFFCAVVVLGYVLLQRLGWEI